MVWKRTFLCDTDYDPRAGVLFVHVSSFRQRGIRECLCQKARFWAGDDLRIEYLSRLLADSFGPYPMPLLRSLLETLPPPPSTHTQRDRITARLEEYRKIPYKSAQMLMSLSILDTTRCTKDDTVIRSDFPSRLPCSRLLIFQCHQPYPHQYKFVYESVSEVAEGGSKSVL